MSEEYTIVRFFFDQGRGREVVRTGVTLEEAKEHCSDPESSSSTCTGAEGLARTELVGPWFDGYEER